MSAEGAPGARPVSLPLEVRGLRHVVGHEARLAIPALEIAAGGITVIMGPNGAGKSLLLRILHGLVRPTAGEVRAGGRPLDGQLRRRQALVFQSPVLLRRSVAGNIRFALRASGVPRRRWPARIASLLEQAGLSDRTRQPARSLSGGERQRLQIVRALVAEPEVLFLDEPTASLDPRATHEIEVMLKALSARGTKIVLVTHDVGQARRLAAEVIFLHHGRVVERAGADAFFASPESAEAAAYISGGLPL
ncbi:MAG: ATP-binding cassette domain-containing protein [Alphaproteobacteria bacterium]|nr:MAG: ATP-binding cassette domain-containing protein [Alphaproteobacteria bacterium]